MTILATALVLALQPMLPYISRARLRDVSEDMIAVVDEEFEKKNVAGSVDKKDALAALAAVAVHESGLRLDVEKCKVAGDAGRSIGLGQIMLGPNWGGHTKKEICGSRKLQLQLSLRTLARCWAQSPRMDAGFRCYASGDAFRYSHAAKSELNIFKKLRGSLDAHAGFIPIPPIRAKEELPRIKDSIVVKMCKFSNQSDSSANSRP